MRIRAFSEALVRFAFRAGHRCQSWCEPITNGVVSGWVWKPAAADEFIAVDIFEDGRLLATVTANLFRPDLAEAKIGRGDHAFRFELPARLLDGREHEIVVTLSGTHVPLRNSPQPITVSFEARIDGLERNTLAGWVWNPWIADAQPELEVLEGGLVIARGKADLLREDLRAAGKGDGRHGFRIPLPGHVMDGEEHTVRVMIAATGKEIPSSPKRIRASFEGYLDGIDAGRNIIAGWVWKPGQQDEPARVDIAVNGRHIGTIAASRFREDLRELGLCDGRVGFEVPIPEPLDPYKSYVISAKISGTDYHLRFSPQLYISPHGVRRALRELHFDLNSLCQGQSGTLLERLGSSAIQDDPVSCDYIRQFLVPSLLEAAPAGNAHVQVRPYLSHTVSANPFPQTDFSSQPVDIIVPVYRGVDATVECLESIGAALVSCPHQVFVIIDDAESNAYSRVLETAGRLGFTVLFNGENEGFVKTVNRGMRLHADRDIILLNSDTLVFGDWIGRLRQAAYRHASIGTVTPLSNNATICSYPRICENNPITPREARELDLLAACANAGETVDIPTAVGFCMYIRRNCLVDAGLFNEDLWGKGYGEENDFCLRATGRGWRHILAGEVFVAHVGHASFQREQSEALIRANSAKLSAIYPHYDSTVAAFIASDPIRRLRRRLDLELARGAGSGCILYVTADLAGGAGRHVKDMAAAAKRQGVSALILDISADRRARLETGQDLPNLTYALDTEIEDLRREIAGLPIRHVHYQHLMNVPERILRLASDLGIPYDCTIHDYSSVCPRASMVDESGLYCGAPDLAVCERCLKLSGAHPLWKSFGQQYGSVGALRAMNARLFSGARRVFCPDEDVKRRLGQYFPLENLIVRAHPDPLPPIQRLPRRTDNSELRVAVIGAVGPYKGYEPLLACARLAYKTGAPVRFIVIGYTCNDKELAAARNVTITGEYAESEVFDLLRKEHPDIAFFPSVCPETYSYTLSIALHAGLYPVAFDLGAIAARIRSAAYGKLMPLTGQPEPILQGLLEAGREARNQEAPAEVAASVRYRDILADYYELGEAAKAGAGV